MRIPWREWLRYRLARLLDHVWRRSCWAELYCWSAGYSPEKTLWDCRKDDCHKLGIGESCWCGKFLSAELRRKFEESRS